MLVTILASLRIQYQRVWLQDFRDTTQRLLRSVFSETSTVIVHPVTMRSVVRDGDVADAGYNTARTK